mmetsp:Transcript_31279/g.65914  ORF Transcript_31279/g.65914 Transcript_31279/m.65914 type:complete len:420 (+) Transcript_31279:1327-2586(+)
MPLRSTVPAAAATAIRTAVVHTAAVLTVAAWRWRRESWQNPRDHQKLRLFGEFVRHWQGEREVLHDCRREQRHVGRCRAVVPKNLEHHLDEREHRLEIASSAGDEIASSGGRCDEIGDGGQRHQRRAARGGSLFCGGEGAGKHALNPTRIDEPSDETLGDDEHTRQVERQELARRRPLLQQGGPRLSDGRCGVLRPRLGRERAARVQVACVRAAEGLDEHRSVRRGRLHRLNVTERVVRQLCKRAGGLARERAQWLRSLQQRCARVRLQLRLLPSRHISGSSRYSWSRHCRSSSSPRRRCCPRRHRRRRRVCGCLWCGCLRHPTLGGVVGPCLGLTHDLERGLDLADAARLGDADLERLPIADGREAAQPQQPQRHRLLPDGRVDLGVGEPHPLVLVVVRVGNHVGEQSADHLQRATCR